MPPNRSQSSRNSTEREARILLAIKAIKNQEISAIRGAARRFEVPKSTLRSRLYRTTFRANSRVNSYKLTEVEEETL